MNRMTLTRDDAVLSVVGYMNAGEGHDYVLFSFQTANAVVDSFWCPILKQTRRPWSRRYLGVLRFANSQRGEKIKGETKKEVSRTLHSPQYTHHSPKRLSP